MSIICEMQRRKVVKVYWGMLLPILDPIRCEHRFLEAARKVGFVDGRAATICETAP